jgi:glycosyltransferase involved in cell wall biosynthesis
MDNSKQLKILFAIHAYKPAWNFGGPAVSVSSLAESLVKKGHKVFVSTTNSNFYEKLDITPNVPHDINGVKVWYFDYTNKIQSIFPYIPYLSKSVGFLYAPAMKQHLLRTMDFIDVVHTQLPFAYPTYVAATIANKKRIPYFYSQRGVLKQKHLKHRSFKKKLYFYAIENRILKHARALVALNNEEMESYKILGLNNPCHIIPNGINVKNYWQHHKGIVQKKLNIPETAKIILFLGRLHWIKKLDCLLDAFIEISKLDHQSFLVIAGPDESGISNALRKKACACGIANRVIFPGMVTGDEKKDLLARADIFCMPSEEEGFSMAILEALASQTPVVISPGCHFDEVAQYSAGIVTSNDPLLLGQAISGLLSQPAELLTMGKNGFCLVKQKYTWDLIADKHIEMYYKYMQNSYGLRR